MNLFTGIEMNYLKLSFLILLVFSISLFAQSDNKKPCSSPQASQFDFWIGEWDLTWTDKNGNKQKGANSITKILNGCVIEENFSGGSFIGKSVSVYSPQKKMWLQTWVDNSGGYLDFTGGYENGKMTLEREFTTKDGKKIKQRMVFYNISENEMDWNWERSTDDGKTWQLAWKIHYIRKIE